MLVVSAAQVISVSHASVVHVAQVDTWNVIVGSAVAVAVLVKEDSHPTVFDDVEFLAQMDTYVVLACEATVLYSEVTFVFLDEKVCE